METIDQAIQQMLDEMISLRKELHRFPEVGFCEHQTAATVSRYLHHQSKYKQALAEPV